MIVLDGFGRDTTHQPIVLDGYGAGSGAVIEESVTTAGGMPQFYGVPTQEAIDRRNFELYGIPIPTDEPEVVETKVVGEVIPAYTEEQKQKFREFVSDQRMIEKFGVPLLPSEIEKVREGILSIGDIIPRSTDWMEEDDEALVLLMMQM